MISLTIEEKRHFANYLEQEAASESQIIKQLEGMNVSEEVIKMRRMEVVAMIRVAQWLKSWSEG